MSKRSAQIDYAFLSAVAAAALAGCNQQEAYHRDWQQCVDERNVVVQDQLCDQRQRTSASAGSGVAPYFYYHWLYSGRRYGMGSLVSGGYLNPLMPGRTVRSSSPGAAALIASDAARSTTRGGFGSSAFAGSGG